MQKCELVSLQISREFSLTSKLLVRKITSAKSPKKPSKEPSLPSQDETRRANVLREEMLSQFRMFGESLSIIREEVTGIKPRLERVEEKATVLESAVRTHSDVVRANTEAIRTIQTDLKSINQRLEVVEAKS